LIVIEPAALVIVTFVPAVKVERAKPEPVPIGRAPTAAADPLIPVPPFAAATIPVTLPARVADPAVVAVVAVAALPLVLLVIVAGKSAAVIAE
jgi:hypothetical protein